MRLSSSQLEAFHAVAETLHFSRAARRLRLTQPALSKRIQLLEEELRTPLFLRSRAGVRLTEAGERLLRHCRVREALEDELRAELHATATGDKAGLSGMLR